ncbi:PAS domain-containing sensor histidine kinase [Luteolibacter soli]|uniref:PAS domain-containing sensor histidine kinase n=1 Tax=Luteolibacter soli TaxID=3135280 RepID=UPI003119C352
MSEASAHPTGADGLGGGENGDGFLAPLRLVWQQHPATVTAGVLAVAVQSILIAGLLIHRQRGMRAEQQLRVSEERYREVVESQTEMVCRYREDTTLTFVNEAYCRFFGKDRSELLGTRFLSLIPTEGHADVMATIDRMIAGKRSVSLEHEVLRPDGSVGWMQWDDYPIYGQHGELLELQGIGKDVTERHRAMEELRQSEKRFAGVFRGSPVAIAIVRQSDGRLVEVNPEWEKFFEIGREEAVGKTPVELGLVGSRDSDRKFREMLDAGEPLRSLEQQVTLRDGTTRWMGLSTELIQLDGEACFVVMSRNITEQRAADEARRGIARSSRLALLGELTASIAHEVNQPLGAILSNAEAAEMLLSRGEASLPEVRQILADIRRDDLRASEVITRVRALVGKRETRMEPLDVNDLLESSMRLVAHDVQRRGVVIGRDYTLNLPVISGDRVQLEQVLLNLLLNAMDAIKGVSLAHRRVMLRSARHGPGTVEISVTDNGHGIAPEKIDRLFDSFYTTKESGMGLGLSLVRSIAEAHAGRVTAENNASGGATFRLVLPTLADP